MKKYFTRVLILSLILVLGLTIGIAYAQGIGTLGLGDPLAPASGYSEVYWFTGVHNEVVGNTKFVTAVHCTNASLVDVDVIVQFFEPSPTEASDYVYANAAIPGNDTVTFSTQSIDSFANENSPLPITIENIQHGSGRVLSTNESGSRLICTIQALTLDSSSGDSIIDASPLDIFQP